MIKRKIDRVCHDLKHFKITFLEHLSLKVIRLGHMGTVQKQNSSGLNGNLQAPIAKVSTPTTKLSAHRCAARSVGKHSFCELAKWVSGGLS
jgi:aspartate aminotransferase-like enzyme